MKHTNPLKKVGFFKKQTYKKDVKLKKAEKVKQQDTPNLTMLFTNAYLERSMSVFIKKASVDMFTKVQECFN